METTQIVTIDYTNYRGERRQRQIEPLRMYFGANEWHPEAQWLIEARDVEKNVTRSFALRSIHSWK